MENGSYSSSSEASSVSSITASDDVEVRKLKDLVKKLEKQNEHLRHRTGKLSSNASKLQKTKTDQPVAGGDAYSNLSSIKLEKTNGFGNDDDDLTLLDENDEAVLSVSIGDEYSWLYRSPKKCKPSPQEKAYSSPQEWLNEEFAHPRTPELAAAPRNIMYRLDGSYGEKNSPDMSYLRHSVEKRLIFPSDDYKAEDATDVKVIARLQQDELQRDSYARIHNNIISETPPSSQHFHRRGSNNDEEGDKNSSSSGSPHHNHHLPVPSQTMTTAHGLYPAHVDEEDAPPVRRSLTPTRADRSLKQPDRIGTSPRARSPARKNPARGLVRKSMPTPSATTHTTSTRSSNPASYSLPSDTHAPGDKQQSQNNTHQPVIKSSLVAPSRISRLQPKSGLPTPGSSSGMPIGRGIPGPRSASPMTSQRRSLPRPSQTSTSLKFGLNKPSPVAARPAPSQRAPAPQLPPPPVNDIWGDDDEVY